MRILYQCCGFLLSMIGGAEVLSYHLVKELSRRGHEVLIVAPCVGSDREGHQTYDGLDLVRLDFDVALASRNFTVLRGVSERVAELVRTFEPDILHLNDVWLGSFFFRRGGATENLPRILTIHGDIRRAGKNGLQARLAADADRVVAVSHAHCDAAMAVMPEVRNKMSVILNALPLPTLLPADLPLAPPVLLCIGRMHMIKGFDVAIRAFAHLSNRGINARLTIAGNGPEKKKLEYLARDLGVAGQVEFTGWVLPDCVPSLINTATMVLMPSRWPEPFGLVALQAAQMGRPIISSAIGGLPEIVEHGLTGLLVGPDDEHSLADAIQDLLSDAPRAKRLGENARQRAREKFDFGAFVDAYERIFAEAKKCPAPHDMTMTG